MREWYADEEANDINSLCDSLNVPLTETPYVNCDTTRELFREANADLGLSLGNGYIGKSVFSIPKYGMVNIHSEILPEFPGAQSIIWPIHQGMEETGFTIHQIDSIIDHGDILFQERFPIQFYPTLRETVEKNLQVSRLRVPKAFSYVCENYTMLRARSISQQFEKSFTTPTIWQFLRMVKNSRALYQKSLAKPSA
jgi:methionyl-tRNA formyltransferase